MEAPNYTEDVIHRIKWRWKWTQEEGKWRPEKLEARCPHCDEHCIVKDTPVGFDARRPSIYFDCPKHPLHLYPFPWIVGTEKEVEARILERIANNQETGERGPEGEAAPSDSRETNQN